MAQIFDMLKRLIRRYVEKNIHDIQHWHISQREHTYICVCMLLTPGTYIPSSLCNILGMMPLQNLT